MTTQVLDTPISDIVLVLVLSAWSLDPVTYGSGHGVIKPGTVLANVGGKYVPIDFAGSGTADEAVAVAYSSADTTSDDKPGVVLARGGCVDTAGLIWPSGATNEQKSVALAQLLALGIVARTAL